MKITPLIPLILILTGCVRWAPDDYYDIPPDRIIDSVPYEEEEEEYLQLAKRANELCTINPIGTFSCARKIMKN